MKTYPRTIVCPVFRANEESTLRCAGVMAKTFGARLLLLKVADDAIRSIRSPGMPDYSIRRIGSLNGTELPALEGANYERFELLGEPTTGIRDFAIRHDADIVVVANDFEFEGVAALGPRTRRIVESLPCTVMIIKEPICGVVEATSSFPATEVSDEELVEEFPVSSWLLDHANKPTEDFPEPASN